MKAKGRASKGQGFAAWVEQNCGFSKRHAYNYICISENWNLIVQSLHDLTTVTDALKAIQDIKSPRLQAQDDVIETVAQETQEKLEAAKVAILY